jgi:hypothetical protein
VRGGTGRIDELNDAAMSRRVELILDFRSSKGTSRRASILAFRSARVGRVLLSVIKVDSKDVGMVTFCREESEGIVNSGMVIVTSTLEVIAWNTRELNGGDSTSKSSH